MKHVTLILAVCFIFIFSMSACMKAGPSRVCPPPEGKVSWICEVSEKHGITPEQVYGWVFSAAAIATLADVVEIEWICDFKKKISDWYVAVYPVSFDSVINYAFAEMTKIKDPRKKALIKSMLNQNLSLYSSPGLIGEYDDWLLRAGSNRFDREMMCGQ